MPKSIYSCLVKRGDKIWVVFSQVDMTLKKTKLDLEEYNRTKGNFFSSLTPILHIILVIFDIFFVGSSVAVDITLKSFRFTFQAYRNLGCLDVVIFLLGVLTWFKPCQ
ncbi:hypothetical protein ACH5RR_014869 [Cinchona calisaya]|uniref:Uncharacterized protein n=1 Tax=Cinchona calisaya TaxID=153742 RepID=A0ABD2ZRI8_9GENT